MRMVLNLNSIVAVTLSSPGLDVWKACKKDAPLEAHRDGRRLNIRLSDLIRVFGPSLADGCDAFEGGDITLLPDGLPHIPRLPRT